MTAAERYYGRLEPVAYDDPDSGGIVQKLAAVFMAPREVFEFIYGTDTYDPWGQLLDPDTCPSELLDWLAVFAGVDLPPSALTDDEKRYRIKQAAGRYRCTPRAVVEELQLVLTGTKTVYVGFHSQAPREWNYAVATIASETPDAAAVDRAVQAQKPVGMIATAVTTDVWSWFVLGPDLVGQRAVLDGVDTYVIGAAEYPLWADVEARFSTWQHLTDNDPDL